MKIVGKLLLNTAIIVLITCSLAAGIEGVARLFYPELEKVVNVDSSWVGTDLAETDPVLGYRLKPSKTTAEYEINSMGFRGPEITREKPANVFRIICFGGSTTIGSNAGHNQYTYPQILEDILNDMLGDCPLRVQVINAGVFGYHSWHSLMLFSRLRDELKPDMIVLMDGLNDLRAAEELSLGDLLSNSLRREQVMSTLVGKPDAGGGGLRAFLLSLRSVRVLLQGFTHAISGTRFEDKLLDWKLSKFGFKDNLAKLVDEAAKANVSVLLVNYPWIVSGKLSDKQELERIHYKSATENLIRLYRYGRARIKTVNETVSVEKHVPLVDPQPAIDKLMEDKKSTAVAYSDSIHFTRIGNFILAKTVVDGLFSQDVFKKFVSSCGEFAPSYWEFRPEDAFRDIYAWADSFDKKEAIPFYVYNALPKMRNVVMDNVQVQPADDGFSMFKVIDPSREGKVRFSVRSGRFYWRRPVAFPRVHSPDERVSLSLLGPGGGKVLLDFPPKDMQPGWTGLKQPHDINLPRTRDEQAFEITLKGENAQYWTFNYAPFFMDSVK